MKIKGFIMVDVRYPHDVGVTEPRHHACLTIEARDHLWVFHEVPGQDFQRQDGIQSKVAYFIHYAHATLPELANYLVFTGNNHGHEGISRCPARPACPARRSEMPEKIL